MKVGGIGTPPPHASWPKDPRPIAVPLPATAGASSGELAIRLWMHRLGSNDASDAGGFQATPQLGYRPLIEKMPRQSAEHRFATVSLGHATLLLFFFFGVAALVLWVRSRLQWLLLSVAGYLGVFPLNVLFLRLPLSFVWCLTTSQLLTLVSDISFLYLVLLLADLPNRAGIRGSRFWWRASLAVSAIDLFGTVETLCQIAMSGGNTHPAFFHFLDWSSEFTSYAYALYIPVLLVACFVLSRLTWPRLLFLAAVSLQDTLSLLAGLLSEEATRVEWMHTLLQRPLLLVYGASLTIVTAARLVLLLAIVYAVWDQLSKQVARQRFVDAELKAAQEIQQILVPAAAERESPGFAVSSVYRPASEVGGDFFQIIPLHGDGTLIVAGDVSGKGLRAAMTVSLVVGALRTLAEYDPSPVAILAGLNRRLLGRTNGGFVTCCVVRVDASGHASMANAGHCQPYLDGSEIDLPNGLPLGLAAEAEYEEIVVTVSQGQQLTLLSDGVVEARNRHGELYGFDRLNELMQNRPTAAHVAETAIGFGQDDDITVVTVTRLAVA